MTETEFPEWATELDKEILELLNSELIMTPAVIAENIDRSRGAVARRLSTLEAGELVEKHGRGKYKITSEGLDLFDHGWTMPLSEEQQKKAAQEDYEMRIRIEENLGISQSEYLSAVTEEYDRLKAENSDLSGDELLTKAFKLVDQKYNDEDSTSDN